MCAHVSLHEAFFYEIMAIYKVLSKILHVIKQYDNIK